MVGKKKMLQINKSIERENEKEVFIMEKKQKNLISIFLLVVGVIFILVAGGIFVSTAWKYLPVFVKQFALLVVAGGLFGSSYGLSKNEKLGWISETLFHLGNSFVGFFVLAIMGGLSGTIAMGGFQIFLASGVMALLVGMKIVVRKTPFDFAAISLLVDSILISGCIAFETTMNCYMYLLGGFTLALAIIDALQQKAKKQDGFALCVGITYLMHACVYALLTTIASFSVIDNISEKQMQIDGVLWLGVVVVITGISWMTRKNTVIRVMNSIAMIWFTFIAINGVANYVDYEGEYGMIMVLTIFVFSILMVLLRRNEITGMLVAAAIIIPYGQLFFYWLDAFVSLFDGIDSTWNTTYNPYSFIIGAAMFALYIMKYGCENIFTEWKESKLLKFAGLQMITGCVIWLASKMVSAWGMVFFLLVAIDMLFVVIVLKNETAKRVFKTFAMLGFVSATSVQPFVEIPSGFYVEWICFLSAMGIVLFRHIWYDKKDQLSIVYFVATCVILGVLLLSNLASGGIGNVLILGMTGIVILITAAMNNDKKYVIASSVTLILLVLYLTREFWLSIAWWVYLFAAGVVLVLLAVKKAKEA